MSIRAASTGTARLAGAAALIAVLTVLARLAGFARTGLFSWLFQQSDLGSVYVVANTVPNIIFEIVAGGALASLVVPVLAGAVAAGDREAVARTAGALLTWVVTLLVPLAVLVAVFAAPIVAVIADDPDPQQVAAGARMLRLFAPQLPLYGIGIVLTGVLQAHRRFAWPVIAPLLSSVTVIGVYLLFLALEGRAPTVAGVGAGGELLLSGGTTLGVVALSLPLLIPLRRLGVRPRLGYHFDAEARTRIGPLVIAGVVTVAAQQIALLVILKRLPIDLGAPIIYNLVQTVYLLPWAVFAVPLAVAAYPTLAAASAVGDEQAYRRTLAPTVRGVLLFSSLGAAVLVGVAGPVARFFFDAPQMVDPTAAAVTAFAPGLLGYGLFAVLSRALYARGAVRDATLAITVGWLVVPAAVIGFALLVPREERVSAVGAANSLGMLVLGALLVAAVYRSAGAGSLAGAGRAAAAGITAALAGAAAARAVLAVLPQLTGKAGALAQGALAAAVAAAVFLALAYLLDRPDVRPLLAALARRLGRLTRRGRGGRADGDTKETVAR